jgi:prepilin-type N-terminal cleavage/methylation domain-containing protein
MSVVVRRGSMGATNVASRWNFPALGFSLVEVLIAMALAGMLLVGVLPMFAKSMSNNVEGNQLTEVTNRARLHVEELMALPVDALELTVPDGDDELVRTELWSQTEERWIEESAWALAEEPLYSRITRVRQFNMDALSGADLEFEDDERLPGGTPASQVEIKEIVVRVNSGRPSFLAAMGRQKSVALRVLKAV